MVSWLGQGRCENTKDSTIHLLPGCSLTQVATKPMHLLTSSPETILSPVFPVPSLLLPSSLGPGFMPKPFTESKEGEAKLLVPESQGCGLKRTRGLCAGSSVRGGTGAGLETVQAVGTPMRGQSLGRER